MNKNVLISQVYLRPAIWDNRLKVYGNRTVVDQCWREIASIMKEDVTALRKKWKYLRDQFSVEYGKSISGDSGGEPSKPKWAYFKPLMFLKDIVKPRAFSNKLTPDKNLSPESQYEFVDYDDHPSNDGTNANYQELSQIAEIENSDIEVVLENSKQENNEETTSHNDNFKTITGGKKKKKTEIDKKRHKLVDSQRESDDMLFFRSLMPFVEKIPQHQKLEFRSRVQQLLAEFAFPKDHVIEQSCTEPTQISSPLSNQSWVKSESSTHTTPKNTPNHFYETYELDLTEL